MHFLANENVPGDAVSALREAGHDVAWMLTETPGSSDRDVLARAMREDRILLTFDKDFGELAYHSALPATCGIVLLRLPLPAPPHAATVITGILTERDDWRGHFAVIEPGRVRMRALPAENSSE